MIKRTTTAKEIAQYLRISYENFIRSGLTAEYADMPKEKIRGKWGFNIEEVMDYIQHKFN